MDEWLDEAEQEYWERILEVKSELSESLINQDFEVDVLRLDDDLWVSGPLSRLMEFCRENRSEIEELG